MEPAAYTVDTFCEAHGLSRGQFYKLCHAGIGPRLMRIGARTRISREAAADWRLAREAETPPFPQIKSPRGGYRPASDPPARKPVDTTATRIA